MKLWHGCDYNPDQWLSLPFDYEIISGELPEGNIGGYGYCVLKLK